MKMGVPIPVAIVAALAIAALVGVLNHLIITYWHVPPIIATLGVFFVVLGANSLITGGLDVLPLPTEFVRLGQGYFIGVPNIIWIAVLVGIVTWFALEHTRFGVNVRALGGNRAAAVANGLHVKKLDLALYAIAAVTGGIAGLLYSARVGAGQVEAGGSATTLVVVTAVLIGGVSLLGGLGNITGVAIGAVLLSLIDNALIVSASHPSSTTSSSAPSSSAPSPSTTSAPAALQAPLTATRLWCLRHRGACWAAQWRRHHDG